MYNSGFLEDYGDSQSLTDYMRSGMYLTNDAEAVVQHFEREYYQFRLLDSKEEIVLGKADFFGNQFYETESDFEEITRKSDDEEPVGTDLKNIFDALIQANKKSNRLMFQNDEERIRFVKNCEKTYKRTTEEHLAHMKEHDFEGNVDERKWAREAMYLKEKGMLF